MPSLSVTLLVPVEVPSKVPVKDPVVTEMLLGVPRSPRVSVDEVMPDMSPLLSVISTVAASIAPVPPVTLVASASTVMSEVLSKPVPTSMVTPTPSTVKVAVSAVPLASVSV